MVGRIWLSNSRKAIKASLTYRSEIMHEVTANENAPLVDMLSTQQGRDFLDQHLAYMVSIGQLTESRRRHSIVLLRAYPKQEHQAQLSLERQSQ